IPRGQVSSRGGNGGSATAAYVAVATLLLASGLAVTAWSEGSSSSNSSRSIGIVSGSISRSIGSSIVSSGRSIGSSSGSSSRISSSSESPHIANGTTSLGDGRNITAPVIAPQLDFGDALDILLRPVASALELFLMATGAVAPVDTIGAEAAVAAPLVGPQFLVGGPLPRDVAGNLIDHRAGSSNTATAIVDNVNRDVEADTVQQQRMLATHRDDNGGSEDDSPSGDYLIYDDLYDILYELSASTDEISDNVEQAATSSEKRQSSTEVGGRSSSSSSSSSSMEENIGTLTAKTVDKNTTDSSADNTGVHNYDGKRTYDMDDLYDDYDHLGAYDMELASDVDPNDIEYASAMDRNGSLYGDGNVPSPYYGVTTDAAMALAATAARLERRHGDAGTHAYADMDTTTAAYDTAVTAVQSDAVQQFGSYSDITDALPQMSHRRRHLLAPGPGAGPGDRDNGRARDRDS
ncbi:hypothetical protein VaNZ11_003847, partial [Volvox africanus]